MISGEYLLLKDFVDNNPFGKDITLKKQEDNTYILETDVSISATGDIFALDGICPLVPATIIYENNYHNTIWVHEIMLCRSTHSDTALLTEN